VTGAEEQEPASGGGDPVAELERFIAESEARGDTVPLEAYEMLARLRELMAALRGLTASLAQRSPTEESSERGSEEGPDRD
jgi:hypothetical protein